jgi:hypothetical protein
MSKEKPVIQKLKAFFSWLDDNILLILVGFLTVFIPLYPKIPFAELIPGYLVRVRLDDLFITGAMVIWFIQLLRRKATLKTPLTFLIILYIFIGLASSLSAIYWTQSVPQTWVHIAKLFLHWFRRIQYFSLFFLAYSAIKTKKHLQIFLAVFLISLAAVSLYGFGQKYLYWPVYSTMNREFSKGIKLYLSEHARVQSTFGGPYDFAAYLVLTLPLSVTLFLFSKKRFFKILSGLAFLLGLWGLMMTSSRSSFLAYMTALIFLFFFFVRKRGLKWTIPRHTIILILSFSFMLLFGDMTERFLQIFKGSSNYEVVSNVIQTMTDAVQQPIISRPANSEPAPTATPKPIVSTDIIIPSDTQPSTVRPDLPADVFTDVPDKVTRTTPEGYEVVVEIPRVFSSTAHLLGLSAAIRLDTLWPLAIKGFMRNPLLGSGYSTLTKFEWGQFTEAESTDNDFLRTLGETGALGFLTFYGVFVLILIILWKAVRSSKDEMLWILTAVLTASTLGLFINALYIDVFVASKLIESYWIFAGVVVAYSVIVQKTMPKPVVASVAVKSQTEKKKKEQKK